jgi:hypothetical protein
MSKGGKHNGKANAFGMLAPARRSEIEAKSEVTEVTVTTVTVTVTTAVTRT